MPVCLHLQQLESLCWGRNSGTIISSHSDGSYAIWPMNTGSSPTLQPSVATVPYGECWGGLKQGWWLEGHLGLVGVSDQPNLQRETPLGGWLLVWYCFPLERGGGSFKLDQK